jgi:hypothetical protein
VAGSAGRLGQHVQQLEFLDLTRPHWAQVTAWMKWSEGERGRPPHGKSKGGARGLLSKKSDWGSQRQGKAGPCQCSQQVCGLWGGMQKQV